MIYREQCVIADMRDSGVQGEITRSDRCFLRKSSGIFGNLGVLDLAKNEISTK